MKLHLRLLIIPLLFWTTPAFAQNYQNYFDTQYSVNQSTFNSMATSGSAPTLGTSGAFYAVLSGTIFAYKAFGSGASPHTYIERALTWSETMVSDATNIDSCGKRNWSGSYTATIGSCNWTNAGLLVDEMLPMQEMARLVALIKTQANLNTTYGARADVVRTFLHDHMVVKWLINRQQESQFITGTSLAQKNSDKRASFVITLTSLDASGFSSTNIRSGLTYRQAAIQALNGFMTILSEPGGNTPCGVGTCTGGISAAGGIVWAYKQLTSTSQCFGGINPCSDDTGHSNFWADAIQTATDNGFSALVNSTPAGRTLSQVAARLERTLTQIIWNQSTVVPQFTNYHDGENVVFRSEPAWRNGYLQYGWISVTHHHSTGISAAEAIMDCVIAGASCTSVSRHYMDTVVGRTAMAGRVGYEQFRFSGGGVPTPILQTSPASLSFNAFVGGNNPANQSITITDTAATGAMGWTCASDVSWLSCSTPSGTGNATISAMVNVSGQSAGTLNGNITITATSATGSPDVIPVTLTMTPPTLTRTPATLSFSAVSGAGNPSNKSIAIDDTANSGVMSWTVTDDVAWISVTPSSGIDDAVLTVSIDVTGLPVAVHNGTITITSTGSVGSPQTVPVDLTITSPPAPPCHMCGGRVR